MTVLLRENKTHGVPSPLPIVENYCTLATSNHEAMLERVKVTRLHRRYCLRSQPDQ